MDSSFVEALVMSTLSEGKLILNTRNEVLFRNKFMSDLSDRYGADLIMSVIVDDCSNVAVLHRYSLERVRVGEFLIVTVSSKGLSTPGIPEEGVFDRVSGTGIPVAVGHCTFRLNTVDGSSVAISVDSEFSELVGVSREILIDHGIPAVGNQVHPDDRVISDLFAKDIVSRRSSGSWPVRIFVDNDYRWRQYEIIISGEPDNDKFVIMDASIIDYSIQAAEMGLVSTPGIKSLELPGGETRHIPMVHHAMTTEMNSLTLLDDTSSTSTSCRSVCADSDDLANISCLKRFLSMRLMRSVDAVLGVTSDACQQVDYIPLDMDCLKEEVSLWVEPAEYMAFEKGIDSQDFVSCTEAMSRGMGLDRHWFSQDHCDISNGNIDRISLSFKFLIALASRVSSIALLRGLYKHIDIATRLGGANLGLLLRLELSLALLALALIPPVSYFKVRENYAWLAALLGSVIDSINSEDGLILQSMYWISIQWGFLHVFIGHRGIAAEIWLSALDDLREYIKKFPNSSTGKKLEKLVTLNISKL